MPEGDAVPAGFALRVAPKPLDEILARPIATEGDRNQYARIAGDLRAAIQAGRLASGDSVPTVDQLASWYGVVRSTAQRAVTALANEGLTTKARGRHVVSPLAAEAAP